MRDVIPSRWSFIKICNYLVGATYKWKIENVGAIHESPVQKHGVIDFRLRVIFPIFFRRKINKYFSHTLITSVRVRKVLCFFLSKKEEKRNRNENIIRNERWSG